MSKYSLKTLKKSLKALVFTKNKYIYHQKLGIIK